MRLVDTMDSLPIKYSDFILIFQVYQFIYNDLRLEHHSTKTFVFIWLATTLVFLISFVLNISYVLGWLVTNTGIM